MVNAQVIYLEQFDLPEGTTIDTGPTAWTRDITNASLGTTGHFETRSNSGITVFEGTFLNGEAVWLSEILDISSFSSVVASIEIAEFGTLEGNDYLELYYRLDNGPEIIFGDYKNDFGSAFISVNSPIISGVTLQIIIRVKNNDLSEIHLFDNIRVLGNPLSSTTLFSNGNRKWNNQNAWSLTGFGGSSCHCTPDSNTSVIIGGDHSIEINTNAEVFSLMIQDNGSLRSNGNHDLFIGGDFGITSNNSDPFDIGARTVVFNGNLDQQVNVNNENIYNIEIVKTGGTLQINQPLNLLGSLNFTTPAELVSNGYLKLISTSDGTTNNASIGSIPDGGTVTGDVTVQRYISGEGEIWRYVSSPVTTATIADWQDDFPITGSFDDPSTGPGVNSSRASVYYYGESMSGGGLNLGWIAYPTSGSAAGNPIIPGVGYAVLMLDGSNPAVMEVKGPINQGNFNFNVSFAGSGWNLLGNPYPATVDWGNTNGWSRSNVANAVYIRDNENGNDNSVVASYVDGVGTNGGTGLVATGQSFWVLALGSNPSLQINERAKSSSSGAFFREKDPLNMFRITLSSGNQSDEAVVRFSNRASLGYDPEMDAKKFNNGGINLSTVIESQDIMAISSIPELNCEQTLEVILSNTKPGDYQLSFTELDRLDLPYAIELIDIYTGSTEQVLNNSIYQFKVSDDTATYKSRFVLSVLPEKLIIQSVTHGHNCTAGPVKLTAVANYSEVPGLQYSWYQDAQIEAPIEVNNTGEFITPELTNSRSYFVAVTGATGCQSEKVEVLATIEQHDTPKINLEAQNILISNYQSGNQWYFNGSAILNANKDILRLDKPGIYRLEVTISQCQFYDEIEIHPADLSPDGNSLIVYPTPAANLLNLSLLQVEDRNVQIAVYNALGKLASTKRLAVYNRKAQLDISHINPGVYFIEVHIDENKYTTRFIKL